ncbi:hypothetical protein Tco_1169037, partial [Tanacetum coccineum]
RSAELIPRFAEAATEMREMNSGVLMSKVDAEMCPKVASGLGLATARMSMQDEPNLLLFVSESS